MPFAPDVVSTGAAGADEPAPAESAAGPDVEPADELSPSTLIALPPTVTGTSAATGAWMPEATPSAPDVVAAAAGAERPERSGRQPEPERPAPPNPLLDESPTALIALPATVTGTLDVHQRLVTGCDAAQPGGRDRPTAQEQQQARPRAEPRTRASRRAR